MFYCRAPVFPTEIHKLAAPSRLFVTVEGRQTTLVVLLLGSSPCRAQRIL